MNARDAFKANLPIFQVSVRGNIVADSETFTSKAGNSFSSFKLAHTFGKDGVTAFIKVLADESVSVHKGDYVELGGDYTESMNDEYLNRTIFAKSVTVLGTASAPSTTAGNLVKGSKVVSKSKARK